MIIPLLSAPQTSVRMKLTYKSVHCDVYQLAVGDVLRQRIFDPSKVFDPLGFNYYWRIAAISRVVCVPPYVDDRGYAQRGEMYRECWRQRVDNGAIDVWILKVGQPVLYEVFGGPKLVAANRNPALVQLCGPNRIWKGTTHGRL
ncbi:MAG: hypothetical protein K8L99_04850 [Anaerolineae bacterium]|nr:hypothetical protein [Anaerolineae bacterium]